MVQVMTVPGSHKGQVSGHQLNFLTHPNMADRSATAQLHFSALLQTKCSLPTPAISVTDDFSRHRAAHSLLLIPTLILPGVYDL